MKKISSINKWAAICIIYFCMSVYSVYSQANIQRTVIQNELHGKAIYFPIDRKNLPEVSAWSIGKPLPISIENVVAIANGFLREELAPNHTLPPVSSVALDRFGRSDLWYYVVWYEFTGSSGHSDAANSMSTAPNTGVFKRHTAQSLQLSRIPFQVESVPPVRLSMGAGIWIFLVMGSGFLSKRPHRRTVQP